MAGEHAYFPTCVFLKLWKCFSVWLISVSTSAGGFVLVLRGSARPVRAVVLFS